jgi:hypothetical protein
MEAPGALHPAALSTAMHPGGGLTAIHTAASVSHDLYCSTCGMVSVLSADKQTVVAVTAHLVAYLFWPACYWTWSPTHLS